MSYRDDLDAARAKIEVLETQLRELREARTPEPVPLPRPSPSPGEGDELDAALAAVEKTMASVEPEPVPRVETDAPTLPPLEPEPESCATCRVELVAGAPTRLPVSGAFARFVVCPACGDVGFRVLG